MIKFYSPSELNDSKLIFNNPSNYYNKNLLDKKYSDIKLVLVDKEALKKLNEKDEKAYKKQMEALNKVGVLGEGLVETFDAFKNFFEGFSSFASSEESLSFFIEDEKEKIVDILIYNGKGEKMNYGSSKMGKSRLTISLKEKVASDWNIEVFVENEKSLKEYKFSVSNIILP